jgi:hypothetical protein
MVECTHSNNTLASRHLIYNETHVAGTYFVHLTSCLCSIVFKNRPTVFPLWPCRLEEVAQTSPVIRLVIPIRWSQVNDSTIIKAMPVESELFPDDGYDNLSAVYRPDWRDVDAVLEIPNPLKFDKFETFVTHTATHAESYYSYGAAIWGTLLTMGIFHVYCKVLGITSRILLAYPSIQYSARALSDCDAKLEHRLNIFFICLIVLKFALIMLVFLALYVCFGKRQTQRRPTGPCVGYFLRCVRGREDDDDTVYRPAQGAGVTCAPLLPLGSPPSMAQRLPAAATVQPSMMGRGRGVLRATRAQNLYPQPDVDMQEA